MNDQRIVQALVEAHQKNPNKITIGIEFERNDFSGYGDYMNAPMTTSYIAERSFYIGNQELPFYDGFEENFNSAEHIPVLKFLVEEAFPQEAREARHSRKDRDGIEEVQEEFQNQLFSLERKFRMASGSEILRNLEMRIARLEKQSASIKTPEDFKKHFDKYLNLISENDSVDDFDCVLRCMKTFASKLHFTLYEDIADRTEAYAYTIRQIFDKAQKKGVSYQEFKKMEGEMRKILYKWEDETKKMIEAKFSSSGSQSVPSVMQVKDFVNNTRTTWGGKLRFRSMSDWGDFKLYFKTNLGSSEYISDHDELHEWETDGIALAEEVQERLKQKFPNLRVGLEDAKDIGIWVEHKGHLVIYLDEDKFTQSSTRSR